MTTNKPLTNLGFIPTKPIIPNQKCILCTCHSDRPLCHLCQSEIVRYRHSVCAGNLMNIPSFNNLLPRLKGQHLFSLGPHKWPLDHLISTLKYQSKSILIPELASLFVNQVLSSEQKKPEAIVAVPMHPIKIWLRGFNQSAMLAQHIGRQLDIPIIDNLVYKRWSMTPQVSKSADQRRRLELSQFRLTKAALPYSNIAIFDDVITTGSTIANLASLIWQKHPSLNIQFWSCSISQKH